MQKHIAYRPDGTCSLYQRGRLPRPAGERVVRWPPDLDLAPVRVFAASVVWRAFCEGDRMPSWQLEVLRALVRDEPTPGRCVMAMGLIDTPSPRAALADESFVYAAVLPQIHDEVLWTTYWFMVPGVIFGVRFGPPEVGVVSDQDLLGEDPVFQVAPAHRFPQLKAAYRTLASAPVRGRLAGS